MHNSGHKKSVEETRQKCQRRTLGEMLLGTRKEERTKKNTVRIVCEREFHRGQRRMAKRAAEALWRSVH